VVDGPVDGAVQVLLTAAAGVLDDAVLRKLAGRLGEADHEPAPIRYRHLVDTLDGLAVAGADGARVAHFLSGDAVVLARMSAAVEVMRAAGFEVGSTGGAAEQLSRAVHWRRFADGPVPAVHRRCATDIARGALRLWTRAHGTPRSVAELPMRNRGARNRQAAVVQVRAQSQLARVQLSAQARAMCAALRTDLGREAAELSPRGLGAFEDRVRQESLRVSTEFDERVSRRLADLAQTAGTPAAGLIDHPGPAGDTRLPMRRSPRLENRLTALLGVGFGFSVSLTTGRLVGDLRPDWTSAAGVGCGALGLVLTLWVVGARRLLTERAATERGIVDAVGSLRVAMEERLLTRVLALESALVADSVDPVLDRRPRAVGDTPN